MLPSVSRHKFYGYRTVDNILLKSQISGGKITIVFTNIIFKDTTNYQETFANSEILHNRILAL